MNWLTEFVRPKIRTLLGQREVPDNLWSQCSSCQQMIFNAELEKKSSRLHPLRPSHEGWRSAAAVLDLR